MFQTKRIRVLQCIRQGLIGGGESHLLSLTENLNKSVFEPIVLSFTDGPMVDRLKDMKIENHVLFTEKPFDIKTWGAVKSLLIEKQIQVIHAHGTRANSNILWAAKSLKIPIIYTIHGWSFHQDQNIFVRGIRIMAERFYIFADRNISVSVSNQQSGKKYIPSFKSTVIANGIDLAKFNPANQFADVKKELGIEKDVLIVLFAARFNAHKQPLPLISAFAKLLPGLPRLHLLMVGDGDQKKEAMALVNKAGIQEQVTLLPFRQDIPALLAATDVFVLPSLWEGLPIGLLEAMAMGKAVIATRVDGTIEIINHKENGYLIETAGIQENLLTALKEVVQNTALRSQFGKNAVTSIRKKYSAEAMTRSIENVYTELISKYPEYLTMEFTRIADIKRLNFIIKVLNERLPENAVVLDVGCGNGVISRTLGKEGFRVKGVDVSEKAINKAIALNTNPRVKFEVRSAEGTRGG